jgi:hypothetical protein
MELNMTVRLTVRELIEQLGSCDPNADVCVWDRNPSTGEFIAVGVKLDPITLAEEEPAAVCFEPAEDGTWFEHTRVERARA